MIKLTASACIEASAANVWDRLARLEDIQLWAEPIISARCAGRISRGVGAERICELKGNMTIVERWVAWNEGHSFTYEGSGMPFVKIARNTWSVRAEGAHRTLLISEAEVELKGGWFGRCVEPIMILMARGMGRNSLAAFKYLVENGRPFEGRHSKLPRVSAVC